MDENQPPFDQEFNQHEQQLIATIKRTLRILATVVEHFDRAAVIRDFNLPTEFEDEDEKERVEDIIRQHQTPDLIKLNVTDESILIGGLGPLIFQELLKQSGD